MHLSSKINAIWDGSVCALQTVKQVVSDIEGILISSDFSSTKLLKQRPFDYPVTSNGPSLGRQKYVLSKLPITYLPFLKFSTHALKDFKPQF